MRVDDALRTAHISKITARARCALRARWVNVNQTYMGFVVQKLLRSEFFAYMVASSILGFKRKCSELDKQNETSAK